MKCLVTGGAGFIGSHLVDALLAEGHDVVVIDNFDPFYDRAVKEHNLAAHRASSRFRLIEADIRDRDAVMDLFQELQPETVVHLAAKAGVRPSLLDPLDYIEVNVNGTVNLLDAAVKSQAAKFIFASSSSVYGLNEKVPFAEGDPILQQASPYGATKAAGEAICRSYSNCFGLPIVALRFFTVYGPRQRPDLAIHKFARMLLEQRSIPIFGDGTTRRDYTYVDDIIQGIQAAIRYCSAGYEVFNLGNDRPVQLIELVRNLEASLGCEAHIDWLPEQVGDVPQTWADISKSRTVLGYEPTVDMRTGLQRFATWLAPKELQKTN